VRDAAAAALGATWNHASFEAERTRNEQQLSAPWRSQTGASPAPIVWIGAIIVGLLGRVAADNPRLVAPSSLHRQ
jgi:hypothetical protein